MTTTLTRPSTRAFPVATGSRITFRLERWLMLPVLLLGWLLRLNQIGGRALWWDEGYSLYFATQSLPDLTARTAADIHPPLYYYLLSGWIALFGAGEVSARLLSAGFSLLSIPLVYALGSRFWGRRTGLLAGLLMAIAPFQVFYAQEARMYAAAGFFALLSTYTCLRWFAPFDKQRRSVVVAYIVATTLMLYTLYYAAFLLPAQALWVLLRRRERFWSWLRLPLATALLYLPWLLYAYLALTTYVANKVAFEGYAPLDPLSFIWSNLSAFAIGSFSPNNPALAVAMALPVLALAALAFVSTIRRHRQALANGSVDRTPSREQAGLSERDVLTYLLFHLFVPLLFGWIVNLRYPFTPVNWERLFLVASPAMVLLAARGVLFLSRQLAPAAILATILVAASAGLGLAAEYTVPRYPLDDYRPVIAEVATYGQPQDAILCIYPWQVGYFRSYFPDATRRPLLYEVPTERWKNTAAMETDLAQLLAEHPRIWLPAQQSFGRILESDIEQFMAQMAFPASSAWYGNVRMLFYASPLFPDWSAATRSQPQNITPAEPVSFDDLVQLQSWQIANSSVPSAVGAAQIDLQWQLLKQTGRRFQVSLRLTDEQGRTWAQRDSEPDAGLAPFNTWQAQEQRDDRHALLIPTGVPPGTYTIRAGLRDSTNNEPLNVLDRNKARSGIEYTLGKLTVVQPPANAIVVPQSIIMQQALSQPSGGAIKLLGYSADQGELRPGEQLRLSLYWQVVSAPQTDTKLVLHLLDRSGKVSAESERQPLNGRYPVANWQPGMYIWDQEEFTIPANATAGSYTLQVVLQQGENAEASIGPVAIGAKPVAKAPVPQHTLHYRFGNQIELVGYDISTTEMRAGEQMRLTLYWLALGTPDKNYKVTAQLLDSQPKVRGQRDALPCDGQCPTTGWATGEYYSDSYTFGPEAGTPPGELRFGVALYDESIQAPNRLPVMDAAGKPIGDFAVLGTLAVK